MAATANELLAEILGVVSRIDRKMETPGAPGARPTDPREQRGIGVGAISTGLLSFARVGDRAKKSFINFSKELVDLVNKMDDPKGFVSFAEGISAISHSIPDLAQGIKELEDIKERRARRGIGIIHMYLKMLDEFGEPRKSRNIKRTIDLFRSISRSARYIDRMFRTISRSVLIISASLLLFAGGLIVLGRIFGVKPGQAILAVVGVIALFVGSFFLLTLAAPFVKEGVRTTRNMGIAMMLLSGGMIAMALSIHLIGEILGLARGEDFEIFGLKIPRMLGSVGFIVATIGGMALIFALLGAAGPVIKIGALSAAAMGFSMLILAGALLAFTGIAFLIEKLEDPKESFTTIGLVVAGIVGVYALLGVAAPVLATGAGVVILISASIASIFGVIWLGVHSLEKIIQGIDRVKSAVGGDAPFHTMKDNITLAISTLLIGTTRGLLYGLTGRKPGEDAPPRGIVRAMASIGILMTGLGVLFSISLTISQFAKALTAFAELGNLRIVEKYTPAGDPVFGEKVNVRQVTQNIVDTFGLFLNMLITETDTLTRSKARALKKLGRALTGRRGILSAVTDFASVLETFSKFGPEGKVGFVEMVPDGVDEDGNAKFKQVPTTVSIQQVATNIASSFGTFVDELVSHTSIFEITGPKGRSMMRLAETLMGSNAIKVFGLSFGREKPGLLEPITKFAEILSKFAREDDLMPVMNDKGEVIGTIDMGDIAVNIVKSLNKFSEHLGAQDVLTNTKKAEDNIGKFSKLMDKTHKLTESIDGIERFATAITRLSEGIGLLSQNLGGLDVDKLQSVAISAERYNIRLKEASVPISEASPSPAVSAATPSAIGPGKPGAVPAVKEPNWDLIAAQIGDAVGQRVVAGLKAGQFKFEFDTTKAGGIYYWSPV